jgi:hypothetical protein
MAFCIVGALSFNLARPESADNRPVFALMLDEAFSKSDPQFAQHALHRHRGDGVQDRGHRPQRPTGRDGGHQDDLGVHHAAPGDARDSETRAGRRVK